MIRNIATLTILCFLAYISFNLESATDVKPSSSDDFSAESAFVYLEEIAKKPHPIGSQENQRVKDYLVKTLKDLGLDVEIQSGYTRTSWKPSYNKMAYVENVIATLKGSDPTAKKIILAGHYDSVKEGPGAADDGYSVACMIETAKMLKGTQRKNDLILLITDGEEYGLLGAQYYVETHEMDDIGLVLNYEARGAEGPGIAFEWSDDNAWLVKEMAKAYERPIANSLSYEIYKVMPNSSDFSEFSLKKVPGINHAFIDGFSYYHHPQDDLNHVSKESIQHTGENMYLAAKHFTNFDFVQQESGNATFFNFYGRLIHYHSDWDTFLFILCLLFACIAIQRLYKHEEVSTKKSLISFFGLLGLLILSAGLCFGLSYLVKTLYPQYSTFYSYHYYNHEWYLFSGLGLVTLFCWWLGSKLKNKYGAKNLAIATMLLLSFLSLAIYLTAITGTYIMMNPLAFFSLGVIGIDFLKNDTSGWKSWTVGIITLALIVGMWTFITHSLYLAFSLFALAPAIIPCVLSCFMMLYLFPSFWEKKNLTLPIFGLLMMVGTLFVAHLQSKPTEAKPLKSNLFYTYDQETGKTYIATSDKYINEGHLGLLDNASTEDLPDHLAFSRFMAETNTDLSSYQSTVTRDSISRPNSVSVNITNPKWATMIDLYIADISNIDSLLIDGEINKSFKDRANGIFYSPLFGIGQEELKITIVKRDANIKVPIHVNVEYSEMPIIENLPKEIVRNRGLVDMSTFVEF